MHSFSSSFCFHRIQLQEFSPKNDEQNEYGRNTPANSPIRQAKLSQSLYTGANTTKSMLTLLFL